MPLNNHGPAAPDDASSASSIVNISANVTMASFLFSTSCSDYVRAARQQPIFRGV
ncbi:hypothetical protein H257_10284 [Aphanomyces astaci]|uniref:Uncharacterized protein n=1 Tax=Aphanomyces astaci TaxID=112090 RepID=W4G6W0_APHAT|nr:hypothetical protein H257_10284 [Aphanomyces astaci]ETV75442.1 hypothetical protein H257_10284 [Aphanomyces astaci]|eukprot:XP_009835076.1 hypothetical protein H257_10284 [Aphanomyces astaci]